MGAAVVAGLDAAPVFGAPRTMRFQASVDGLIGIRRAMRARGHFPSDEAATKLLYLILNRSEKEWRMPPREWSMAKAQFAVLFGERFIKAMAA